jgi:restriction endonuclease-like protein
VKATIVRQQKAWASRQGFVPDARGYLPELKSNLFSPLSDVALAAFQGGAGQELADGPARGKKPGRPAKMRALHSSSALVVNVFDYWTPRDKAALAKSLGLKWKVTSIGYEAKPMTGLPGIPPNLDLELVLSDGTVVAVESKFTEWLTRKRGDGERFKAKYFANGSLHWAQRKLPGCQKLAEELNSKQCHYEFLDAPQLLKHALGLATQRGDKFSLLYLYFDFSGTPATTHKAELSDFSRRLDPHLRFRAMSYQQLFDGLKRYAGSDHSSYLGYLGDRYFGAAA